MITIRLAEPRVDGQEVRFEWNCEPETDFYRRNHFTLRFPGSVDVSAVPEGLWLRVMLICLHNHWPLLRPCRIEIPRTLPEGEREFWLRLTDAAVWTLEFDGETPTRSGRTRRSVEIVDFGPPSGELTHRPDGDLVATSFSGGRDSLAQLGMLVELGLRPLLVTTVSPRDASIEFETDRFRRTLAEVQELLGVDLVEVRSDIRDCWENGHPAAARYGVAVSEVTDTLLYFATCWAVAWARGANAVFLASEAEAQETIRADGGVAQIEHFAYSAATQMALGSLAAPTGIDYSSLTATMQHFQIHRLLSVRYPHLRGLQYSCYEQRDGEDVCSRCYSCFKTAIYLMSDGVNPAEVEIDFQQAVVERSEWKPMGALSSHSQSTVAKGYTRRLDDHLLRVLRDLDTRQVAAFAPGGALSPEAEAAWERLRATAFAAEAPPAEPGYREGFLELLDPPLREGMNAILSDQFDPDPPSEYDELLANTQLLGEWLSAPLA